MRALLLLLVLAAPTASAAEVRLTARDGDGADFRFERDGARNPSFTIGAGETLVVRLLNAGTTGHNWQVGPAADPFSAVPFPLDPGRNGTANFSSTTAGTFRYYCLAHEAQGMYGAIFVAGAATPAPGALLALLAGLAAFGLARRLR